MEGEDENVALSGAEIIAKQKNKQMLKDQQELEAKRKKLERGCKAIDRTTVQRKEGSSGWKFCARCNKFGFCARHSKSHKEALAQHENTCGQ